MENDELLDEFYLEVGELFDDAEKALVDIDDAQKYDQSYNSLYRALHSIKGSAGMFGLLKLQKHIHFMESLIEEKKEVSAISPVLVDYLLSGVDVAKKILNNEEVTFEYYDPDNKVKNSSSTVPNTVTSNKVKANNKLESPEGLVYVIDDDPDIIEVVELALESINYESRTFLDPHKCLSALETEVPDLIITDINMPIMSGVELISKAAKLRPYLPIIILSGFVTKEICLKTIASGVSGIIEKPFDHDVFLKLVALNVKKYQNVKLLNQSIDLIVHQYEDFNKFLLENGGEPRRDKFRDELKTILVQKKKIFERLD